MVRLIGILIGLGFVLVAGISLATGVIAYVTSEHPESAEHRFHLAPRSEFTFASDGPLGRFDEQQLQRGFQVFREVCASCHSLNYVAFRNLADIGYNEAEIRKIAETWPNQVPDVNPQTGEAAGRTPLPADRMVGPYANEVAARAANNNAAPPDLSLIVKARHGGNEYIASLLTGYRNPETYRNEEGEALPRENRPPQGLHFNPWFQNLNLAMPPPLRQAGQVTYAQGQPEPTVGQMAQDVAAFLTWTAEPNLQVRHRAGVAALIFLAFASLLSYLAYKNVWAHAKRAVRATGPLDPVNMAKNDAAKDEAGIAG
jgi:ubiquinol-cytochrome c reductase cytochrome c1 subunit